MSWHFPILVTIRELPFKNYRGRSAENLKAKDKIEEAKKQTSLKYKMKIGILQMETFLDLPGIPHLHPHLLPGETGALRPNA